MTTPSTLRCCVIGAGRMGQRHVQAACDVGFAVCGIADHLDNAAQAARKAFKLPAQSVYTDAHRMLDELAPDAVVVATTAPAHCEFVLAAARRGARYILCEKPMSNSLDEADRMIEACARAGAALAVNHQMRFMPPYSRVKALIGQPEFGALVSVVVSGSNFGLAMNASHYFELFRYLADAPVEQVSSWLESTPMANPRGAEFEDRSGRLLATNAKGQALYVDFSARAGHGVQTTYVCTFGQIMVDELSGDVRMVARRAEHRDLPTTRYGMPADVRQLSLDPVDTVAPTSAVWRAMLAGEPYPTGADGLHALTCVVAAHASDRLGGQPVRLADPGLSREQRFPWA